MCIRKIPAFNSIKYKSMVFTLMNKGSTGKIPLKSTCTGEEEWVFSLGNLWGIYFFHHQIYADSLLKVLRGVLIP